MLQLFDHSLGRGVRLFALPLALLSLLALAVTVWILHDLEHEQEIVSEIIKYLPASELADARELSGTLQLQHRLSVLLVLNVIGTTIAFLFLVRAYVSSEQSLRDAKVLATDIRASMDAAIITTDRQGRITSINPRGRELVGLSDEWIGERLADVGREHALLESLRVDVSRHHKSIRDREYCVHNRGHTRTLRAGCTLLRNQRSTEIGTVVHVSDVTERAFMEERLRRMERYMGLGSLAAGLQHEIKNPLSALSLHIQLLHEQLSTDHVDHDVEESLTVLRNEVRRISTVLDGFGNYASTTQLGRTPVDTQLLIDRLIRLLRPQATQQKVALDVQAASLTLPLVPADPVRLEQVLLNLALNGLAAMPQGGQLLFQLGQRETMFEISVSDSGHGIPSEIQSQIFDPYFTTKHDGTGMGLALCEKIIRQHDGSIDFTTGPQGTTFRISLPLEAPHEPL
ncbi:MAG: PAS domain S-box protein [Planctomycetales bacterium]|nr:PAS domain S-box protein [Planctomycetales bacterium]